MKAVIRFKLRRKGVQVRVFFKDHDLNTVNDIDEL